MHNLLNNTRTLSSRSADQLLHGLRLSIPDLLWQPVEGAHAGISSVPVLRTAIGPGREAAFHIHRAHLPMPAELLEGLVDPVLARLAPDLMLPAAFAPNDLVLLDQNPVLRSAPLDGYHWVIAEGGGLRIRALRLAAEGIQMAAAGIQMPAAGGPGAAQQWRLLKSAHKALRETIRARVVWLGRELKPDTPVSGERE